MRRIDVRRAVFITAMHRLSLALAAVAVAAVLAAPPDAHAVRTGSCLAPDVSATCAVWTGKVTYIGDGDTIYVNVDGDGSRRSVSVRLIGINAPEQTVYSTIAARRRGECHAVEATARLEQLIRRSRWRVRLAAQSPASQSRRRLRRAVAVRSGGRWRDVGRTLVAEGHALWLPNRVENAWNHGYSRLAERAARLGWGIWNPSYCGAGPSENAPLQLWVSADADGRRGDHVDQEWIRIRNLDPLAAVPLGGWWVRDSQLRRYTFPDWATIEPGESITVHVGRGHDTWTELFWGLRKPVFDNPTNDHRALGDGAYLFDPDGDLRAWMQYPCRTGCSDPNEGAIQISADTERPERIALRNVAAHAVDLAPYRLVSRRHSYAFSRDAVLNPGEEMQIEVEGDPGLDTRLLKHWGERRPILRNQGAAVRLQTFDGIELGCYAYGDAVC